MPPKIQSFPSTAVDAAYWRRKGRSATGCQSRFAGSFGGGRPPVAPTSARHRRRRPAAPPRRRRARSRRPPRAPPGCAASAALGGGPGSSARSGTRPAGGGLGGGDGAACGRGAPRRLAAPVLRRRRRHPGRLGSEDLVLVGVGAGGVRGLEGGAGDLGALLAHGRVHRCGQLRGAAVAVVRLLRGRTRDDVVERLDELRALQARRRTRVLDVRPELRHVVVLGVRDLAGEHLVQHAAQGVDIGAAVDRRGLDLLGRDVVRRADPCAGARQAADRPEPLGQPEVGEVDLLVVALAADQDVRRLDVAMHEAARRGRRRAPRPRPR